MVHVATGDNQRRPERGRAHGRLRPVIQVRTVASPADVDRALDLAEAVWGERPLDSHTMRALELAGCYISVAEEPGRTEPVGMCLGIVGVQDDGWHLHSHLAGVVPDRRGAGVGRALKRHQRDWCLERDIGIVTWTFDPLVTVNARFNLHHLGATVVSHHVDLYGPADDAINRGQATDRLLARWDLTGERAVAALAGPLPTPTPAEVGALVAAGAARTISTPVDIVALRRDDPAAAERWRAEVRAAMQDAFAAGLRPRAVTTDGAYLCTREDP